MRTETLSDDFKNRLRLKAGSASSSMKTKTTGLDKIKKAQESNDDCAILSMFLPFQSAEEDNRRFRCSLGPDKCLLGNWKLATPGNNLKKRTPKKPSVNCLIILLQIFKLLKKT